MKIRNPTPKRNLVRSWSILTDPSPKRNLVREQKILINHFGSHPKENFGWKRKRILHIKKKLTLTFGIASQSLRSWPQSSPTTTTTTTTLTVLWPVGFAAGKKDIKNQKRWGHKNGTKKILRRLWMVGYSILFYVSVHLFLTGSDTFGTWKTKFVMRAALDLQDVSDGPQQALWRGRGSGPTGPFGRFGWTGSHWAKKKQTWLRKVLCKVPRQMASKVTRKSWRTKFGNFHLRSKTLWSLK